MLSLKPPKDSAVRWTLENQFLSSAKGTKCASTIHTYKLKYKINGIGFDYE